MPQIEEILLAKIKPKENQVKMKKELIAPCGMNCGICRAYLRHRDPCHDCNNVDKNQPRTRVNCRLRICTKRKGEFCYNCAEFPCNSLKHLDKRYRAKYGMSEIENLNYIRNNGIKKFIEKENKKWISNQGILCVHDKKYYKPVTL